jgi:hypothetical protein
MLPAYGDLTLNQLEGPVVSELGNHAQQTQGSEAGLRVSFHVMCVSFAHFVSTFFVGRPKLQGANNRDNEPPVPILVALTVRLGLVLPRLLAHHKLRRRGRSEPRPHTANGGARGRVSHLVLKPGSEGSLK